MGEEIAFESGRISDFQGLMTLTLDRVILHTVMHHLSTSMYIPNFIEIVEIFCGRTDGRMEGHLRLALLGRLGGVHLKTVITSFTKICILQSGRSTSSWQTTYSPSVDPGQQIVYEWRQTAEQQALLGNQQLHHRWNVWRDEWWQRAMMEQTATLGVLTSQN